MWRASSTCWVARNVASSSEPWAPTSPENFVVIRSSATISDESAKGTSPRCCSSRAGHGSRSASGLIAKGDHCESSQRRYRVCGSLRVVSSPERGDINPSMGGQGSSCWLLDLSQDLRLESVLDKTIETAKRAVPGREFALLVM